MNAPQGWLMGCCAVIAVWERRRRHAHSGIPTFASIPYRSYRSILRRGVLAVKQVDVTVLTSEFITYRIEVPDDVDVEDQEAVELVFYAGDDWPVVYRGSGDSFIHEISEVWV